MMEPTPACTPDEEGHCSLCGDDAIRAVVFGIDTPTAMAWVRTDGSTHVIATDLLDNVRIGDVVLVHQGFAIGRAGP